MQGWQELHSAESPEKANYLDCIAEMQSLQVKQDYIINPAFSIPICYLSIPILIAV